MGGKIRSDLTIPEYLRQFSRSGLLYNPAQEYRTGLCIQPCSGVECIYCTLYNPALEAYMYLGFGHRIINDRMERSVKRRRFMHNVL